MDKIQKSTKFFQIVIEANAIYNLGLDGFFLDGISKNNSKKKNLSPVETKVFSSFLGKIISRTLNNMEYFALHFTHNAADNSVIYKSLHQTYIDIVQMLYYHIAKENPMSPSKYFTNVIELYVLWHDKSKEDEENFAKGIRLLTDKGTVIQNK